MRTLCNRLLCFFLIILLAGCGARSTLAPVSEVKWQAFSRYQKSHVVRRGETLYAIAFRYDTDYRRVALLNHIRPPYSLRVGQVLNLQGLARLQKKPQQMRAPSHYYRPLVKAKVKAKPRAIYSSALSTRSSSGWLWPVSGRVVTSFIPAQGKKGINIASKKGEKVHAAAGGVVAYAGSGLTGYGNLIIIKHNNEYLTAYGNNAKNLVSEGQHVKPGQIIAEVGVMERKYWGVHFEIRKMGIPVNPLNYLQKG